ncbi:MAG: hypothetical protein JWQ09_5601, partial [Segetibacter sp.]|nr:hypothetical protein [Segetibacter sp.]
VQFAVSIVKTFQRRFCQLNRNLFIILLDLVVFLRLLCLVLKGFQLVVDLEQQVLDPVQVTLGCVQFRLRLFLTGLVNGDTGSLLQHPPPAVLLIANNIVHHSQLDDRITVGAHSRIHKQVMDILHTTAHIVQAILTLPVLIKFTGYSHRAKLGRQQILGVLKSQAHLGKTTCATGTAAVKNQRLEVFTPQCTDLLLSNHPPDAVNNIALAATVRPDDAGNTLIKV